MSKESLEKRSNTKRKLGQVPPSWKGKKQSKGHIKKRINSRPENIGKLISKEKKEKATDQKAGYIQNMKKKSYINPGEKKFFIYLLILYTVR